MPPKIENPVNNPKVPPTDDSMEENCAALSFVTTSIVGVLKLIFTNFSLSFHSLSRKYINERMRMHVNLYSVDFSG